LYTQYIKFYDYFGYGIIWTLQINNNFMESNEIEVKEGTNKNLDINPTQIHQGAVQPTAEELANVNNEQEIRRLEEDIAKEEGSEKPDIDGIRFMRKQLYRRRGF
jgi:hypothetical protein